MGYPTNHRLNQAPRPGVAAMALVAALIGVSGPCAAASTEADSSPAGKTAPVAKPSDKGLRRSTSPAPAPTVKTQSPGAATQGAAAHKLDQLLSAILRARSMREVQSLRKAARLSAGERARLETALKGPRYKAHLARLSRAPSGGVKTVPGSRTPVAAPRTGLARGTGSPAQTARSSSAPTRLGAGTTARGRSVLPDAPIAFIDRLTPESPQVNATLVIDGRQFGGSRGQVLLLFTAHGTHVSLDVQQWHDTSIRVRLGPQVAPLIGESGRQATLWVKPPHGDGLGPTRELFVEPDPAAQQPTITLLSSPVVSPGDTITIAGQNFLEDAAGEVRFVFGATAFAARVPPGGWRDGTVQALLPDDVLASVTMSGQVELTNHRGHSASHAIDFRPRVATAELQDSVIAEQCGEINPLRVATLLAEHGALTNGWRVVDWSWSETPGGMHVCGILGGRSSTQPQAGGRDARLKLIVRCAPDTDVECAVRVRIQGPFGTSYQ